MLYYKPDKNEFRLAALLVFSLAVFTDAFDGFLARVRHQKTKLGSFLDPLADKFLLTAAYLVLAVNTALEVRLPLWIPVLVISRDIIILVGIILIIILVGEIKIKPTILGKITTAAQMATVIGTFLTLPLTFLHPLWYITMVVTVLSGLDYIFKGIKILNSHANSKSE
jgi:cardiolipin synthase